MRMELQFIFRDQISYNFSNMSDQTSDKFPLLEELLVTVNESWLASDLTKKIPERTFRSVESLSIIYPYHGSDPETRKLYKVNLFDLFRGLYNVRISEKFYDESYPEVGNANNWKSDNGQITRCITYKIKYKKENIVAVPRSD